MDPYVRNRVLAPILIPIAVLGSMVLVIGIFALTLLYNTHAGSLMLAAVVAGGILFTVSLVSSRDRPGVARAVAAVAAGIVLPLLAGGSIAVGLIGGVDDADRMINAEPILVIPDDTPVLAAENASEFCLPANGECTPTENWEVTPSTEVDAIAFVYDHRDPAAPHNLVIAELAGTPDAPAAGPDILVSGSPISDGQQYYVDDELTWDDLDEQWYFYCQVHPNMNGVGTIVTD